MKKCENCLGAKKTKKFSRYFQSKMEEPVPHVDMLPKTWESIQELFKKLNHTSLNDSIWMKKNKLLQCCGKPYLQIKNGSKLFWIHLRILAQAGNLPRYGSRNNKGIRMCFNNKKKKLTTTWCKLCSSLLCNSKCNQCVKVIRFLKSPHEQTKPNPLDFSDFMIKHSSDTIVHSHFKGEDFTKYLLPIVLKEKHSEVFIPRFLQVILDSNMSAFATVQTMLNGIYGKRKSCGNLWIAPTHDDNDHISLSKPIKMTNENSIGLLGGRYFVWGFNCKHVSKWHDLQTNDYVLFGNTRNGFYRLGKVQHKFVWINDASSDVFAYFSTAGIWLYGFTIVFEPVQFLIPGIEMNSFTGFHYQSQCKLKPDVKKKIAAKYPQLAKFC
jgi:hypothetical protein